MSLDLKDLRLKITPETDCVLRARARATGKDINELAREVLHEWAGGEIHAATVMVGLLTSEGLAGGLQGKAGKPGATQAHAMIRPEGGLDWEQQS